MTPRETVPADAPALAALHAACFAAEDAWGPGAIATMLGLRGGFGLWFPEAGLVLAHVAADESEILTLCIVPPRRRQGLGQALLAAAMQGAVLRGAATMFLEVGASNGAGGALYAAMGFTRVGRRPAYYRDRGDALVLRRELAPIGAAPG